MTIKYMQKSFSNYANIEYKDSCDMCGESCSVYMITIEGRLCNNCYQKKKKEKLKKQIEEIKD